MQTPTAPLPAAPPRQLREDRAVAGIREAAEATGMSFDFLLAQATQESGLNPEAKSRRSSAAGLFQFTAGTWMEMVRKHGGKYGLEAEARAVTADRSGKLSVADPAMKKHILDLRRDPKLSALMAAEYAKSNARTLEARLGRQATEHDLTLAHFLGAGGALRVLQGVEEQPRKVAAHVLPEAARANPEVFREPGSRRQRSLLSLYNEVAARFAGALEDAAPAARRSRPQLDLATLRPAARPEEGTLEIASLVPTTPPQYVERQPFAQASEPASPFFPVPLPPPAGTSARADGPTLRGLIQAMEDGKA